MLFSPTRPPNTVTPAPAKKKHNRYLSVNFEVNGTNETTSPFDTKKANKSAEYGPPNPKKKFWKRMPGFIKTRWISLDVLFDFAQESIPRRQQATHRHPQ